MSKNNAAILSPNLPKGLVSVVVVSPENEAVLGALQGLGVEPLCTQANEALSKPVQFHADMLCLHLGSNEFIVEQGQTGLIKQLEERKMTVHLYKIKKACYPFEAALNVSLLGNFCFDNLKLADRPSVPSFFQPIHVNQGYAKCNMAIVNNHAIITQDANIAVRAKQQGIDVLFIEETAIKLEGYNYGFIGGCCGLIAPDKLAFTGDILRHKCGREIEAFLQKHHVQAVALTDDTLTDIGGILPIIEG